MTTSEPSGARLESNSGARKSVDARTVGIETIVANTNFTTLEKLNSLDFDFDSDEGDGVRSAGRGRDWGMGRGGKGERKEGWWVRVRG